MSEATYAFGGERVWNPIVQIRPAAELDKMVGPGSETRHPIVSWRACIKSKDGSLAQETMQMKATKVSFDRHGDSVKFRFLVTGYEQTAKEEVGECKAEDFSTSSLLTTQELRLTTRVNWETSSFKWKSKSSAGLATRTAVVECKFNDDNMQPSDILRIEVFSPKTSEFDKGKRLIKALEWGKLVVDANLKFQELIRDDGM
ncbi:hypothetical protein SEMRO_2361_G324800.1 [Seminavis robusta]|uniref:Uncharacterized protein n=1 Tax=Seminavis robusta TaxID=568900 RepID=A0A9N8EY45_9STRA|nr:hypothetical protein SEMRO_2361_G324800.1 [Seminavis robusta]|eukprot:Sro2361_g324800.1 n/a (201) ;mRNA; f:9007-9609